MDALLSELKDQLARGSEEGDEQKSAEITSHQGKARCVRIDELAEAIAERVWARIEGQLRK